MRDDLDAPYVGAPIAFCPSCDQPKGRGYGCAVLPRAPQNAHSVDSDAAALPDGSRPLPRQEGGEAVLPVARKDFLGLSIDQERKGIRKYGRSLHTQNDRDPLDDLAEELVDAFHYLTQARMEKDAKDPALALATEVLEHINQWATLAAEGERFPWIAARTAAALAGLALAGGGTE